MTAKILEMPQRFRFQLEPNTHLACGHSIGWHCECPDRYGPPMTTQEYYAKMANKRAEVFYLFPLTTERP